MRNSNGSARRNFFRSSSRRLRVGAAGAQPVAPGLQLTQLGVATGPVTLGGPQSLIASSANGSPATTGTSGAGSTSGSTKENRLANGTGAKGQQQSKGASSKQQQQQNNLARLSPLDTNMNSNNNNNNGTDNSSNGSGNQTGRSKSNSNNSPGDFSGSGTGAGGPASSNGGFSYFSGK